MKKIVITGAAGFIGYYLYNYLKERENGPFILVDFFDSKKKNDIATGDGDTLIHADEFLSWARLHADELSAIYHLGARTDTIETDYRIFLERNLNYSKSVWNICAENGIPLVYASSAATYGDGSHGFDDNISGAGILQPLNAYARSKQEFDEWIAGSSHQPPFWAGLKFFNVYGPYEYHKGRMASVIFHAYHQIRNTGYVQLFKSHHPDYKDGGQLRDFIYVRDIARVCAWLMEAQPPSGIYNLGTGKARSFEDLARSTFHALELDPDIRYIDMPEDLRGKYQYFTEANMGKLINAGYPHSFTSLEEGVSDYVVNYLQKL